MARPLAAAVLCALCGAATAEEADSRHAAAVAKLADQFTHGSPYQRSNAAEALQHDGAADAAAADAVLAVTLSAIDGQQWPVARMGVDTLAAIKPGALAGCAAPLQHGMDGGKDARRECVRLAATLGAAGASLAPKLAALVSDPECRIDVLRALAAFGPTVDGVVPAILGAARDSDAATARAGIEALGRLGPSVKDATATLCGLLARDDVREAALAALGGFGRAAADAMPQVLEAEKQYGHGAQLACFVRTLQQIEPKDIPPVGAAAKGSCREGGVVEIDLSASDVDDLPAALRGAVVGTPAHGRVEVRDRLHLIYHAGWGFVGDETLAWRLSDGRSPGQPVPLVISIAAEPDPPRAVNFLLMDQHERLRVGFDKPPEKTSAETPANYAINQGISVLGASLLADERTVELRTSGLEPGTAYQLSVHKVASRALTAKTLEADSLPFTASQFVPGLRCETFANQNLTGQPESTGVSACLNFAKGPQPGREHYGNRWTGRVQAPAGGTWTFYVTCDDGGRLWVGGKQLVDAWRAQSATEYHGTIDLDAGKPYDIKVEYFNGAGGGTLTLSWSGPGTAKQIVPTSALSTTP
jgi:hypothetical protein